MAKAEEPGLAHGSLLQAARLGATPGATQAQTEVCKGPRAVLTAAKRAMPPAAAAALAGSGSCPRPSLTGLPSSAAQKTSAAAARLHSPRWPPRT